MKIGNTDILIQIVIIHTMVREKKDIEKKYPAA